MADNDALVECPVCGELAYLARHRHTEAELRRALRGPEDLLAMHTLGNPRNRAERRAYRSRARRLLRQAGRLMRP